jgi:hypothetical protein
VARASGVQRSNSSPTRRDRVNRGMDGGMEDSNSEQRSSEKRAASKESGQVQTAMQESAETDIEPQTALVCPGGVLFFSSLFSPLPASASSASLLLHEHRDGLMVMLIKIERYTLPKGKENPRWVPSLSISDPAELILMGEISTHCSRTLPRGRQMGPPVRVLRAPNCNEAVFEFGAIGYQMFPRPNKRIGEDVRQPCFPVLPKDDDVGRAQG